MKARVETYKPEYEEDVRKIVENFYNEALNEYNGTFNPAMIDSLIEQHADNILVLFDKKCEGVLAGIDVVNPITGEKVFQELLWYMNKKHRHYGIILLRQAEKILKERGYKAIVMACMHNSKTQKLFTFYRKMGYIPLETHFMRRI